MTHSGKPKTLSLKDRARPQASDSRTPRQRSGARARTVAQRQIAADTSEKPSETVSANPEKIRKKSRTPTQRTRTTTQQPASSTRSIPNRTRSPRHESRQSQTHSDVDTVFPIFVPCPRGLEQALATELQAIGFRNSQAARSGCSLSGTWNDMMRINLHSRLATRVLLQVSRGPATSEEAVYELARKTPWEQWFGPEQTLRVDTSAIRSPMQSLQYCNLLAKDGICDRLRDREGARPDIDTVRPDARVHLFLDADSATFYLDTSGESLFKRGWRFDKQEAPIRENLAAGMLHLAGWNPAQPLLDPFCGSGTLLIEAAWIARKIPPGLRRPFAFQRLRNYAASDWESLKAEAESAMFTGPLPGLFGSDLNSEAIAAARQNCARAGLSTDDIQFELADAETLKAPAANGQIITNPPYGERLTGNDAPFWSRFASNLKQNFDGWQVHIISSDFDLPKKMRLKPRRKHPLFNGPLDCRLFSFDIVQAGYR